MQRDLPHGMRQADGRALRLSGEEVLAPLLGKLPSSAKTDLGAILAVVLAIINKFVYYEVE
ncbi:MAG: hypothetical protein IIZ73_02510 [Ruminococcus sp.]|nr:hypothetical protein [Ruminococcus sp.]